MSEEITWTCHICGVRRLDALIAVASYDTSAEFDLPIGTMRQNVRYCSDKPECVEGVKTYRFFKKGAADAE